MANAIKINLTKVEGDNVVIHVYRTPTWNIDSSGIIKEEYTYEVASIDQDAYDTNYNSHKEDGQYVIYDIDKVTANTWGTSKDIRLFPLAVTYKNYLGGYQNTPSIPYNMSMDNGIVTLKTSAINTDSSDYSYYATAIKEGYVIGDSLSVGYSNCNVQSNVPVSQILTKVYKNVNGKWIEVASTPINNLIEGVTVQDFTTTFNKWENVAGSELQMGYSSQDYLAIRLPNVLNNQGKKTSYSKSQFDGGTYKILNENVNGAVYQETEQVLTLDKSSQNVNVNEVSIKYETNGGEISTLHLIGTSHERYSELQSLLGDSKKVTDFYDIIVVPGPNVSNDNNFNHGYCFYSDDNYNGDEFIKMYFFEKMAGTSAENGIKKVTIEAKCNSQIVYSHEYICEDLYGSLQPLGYLGGERVFLEHQF